MDYPNDPRMKRFTLEQCDHIYELYSYMIDVSMETPSGELPKLNYRRLDNLAMNAATVLSEVLHMTDKKLRPARYKTGKKVIPMKRRTV